jgi:dTDP-4-amino-4,6-dideoxygalactose transaminase
MKKLDFFIRRRREIAARYDEVFADMEEVILPVERDYVKSVFHIYVIQLRSEKLKVGRKEVFEALRAENIGVNVHYVPVHLQPFYRREFGYQRGDFPVAERYYDRAITLPVFPRMSDKDVEDVIKALEKVIGHYRK